MIRDIPFVAKRPTGATPWTAFGGSREDYERWAPHVCAMACCRSLILARHGSAPSLWELTRSAAVLGVYVEELGDIRGAFHVPLVRFLASFEIDAYRFGGLRSEALAAAVAEGPVMLSVDLAAVDAKHAGSHLVLAIGMSAKRYVVHDNAGLLCPAGASCQLSAAQLEKISNAKGVATTGWGPSLTASA